MNKQLDFTSPPYISQVFLVVDHDPDERVRYRLAEAEDAFASVIKGEFRSTNVKSDAPPEVPRFEVQDGKKHLLIAQSRIQLALSFDSSLHIERSYEVVTRHARMFFEAVGTFHGKDANAILGFVIHISQPSTRPKSEISSFIATQLYKGPEFDELATIDVRLGFQAQNGLYKNFAFNTYEVRQLELTSEHKSKGFVNVNVNKVPVTEMGLACVLDINNKARATNSGMAGGFEYVQTVQQLLEGMDEMFHTQRHQFLNNAAPSA